MTYYMPTPAKRRIRWRLFHDQSGSCAYCRRGMTMDSKHCRKANHATLDHLMPLALGGSTRLDNLVLCCRLCNGVKGSSTLEEFIFGLLWIWLYKHMPLLAFELHRMLARQVSPCPRSSHRSPSVRSPARGPRWGR